MAKKQISFAEKAAKKQGKQDWKFVKYVKSVISEKTGHWRFKENMIRLEGGENLDAALKRMESAADHLQADIQEMTEEVQAAVDATPEKVSEEVSDKSEKAVEAQPEEAKTDVGQPAEAVEKTEAQDVKPEVDKKVDAAPEEKPEKEQTPEVKADAIEPKTDDKTDVESEKVEVESKTEEAPKTEEKVAAETVVEAAPAEDKSEEANTPDSPKEVTAEQPKEK